MRTSLIHRLLCIAATLSLAVPALADPPARVGRISHLEGNTQFFADRDEGWQAARLNFPVTGENSLWVDGPGRAEVRIGAAAIRIDDDSVFDFVSIDEERIEAFLQRGSASIRLRQYGNLGIDEAMLIETSDGRFILDAGGRYRIDAPAGGNETRLSVFAGRARFENGDTRLSIDAGKVLSIRAQGTATDFRFDNAVESSFDRWAAARDQQWDQTHTRYTRESVISPYMTGYEDLDQYGEWFEESEYGRVWAPRVVASGWAPYRYGRWSYVRPWGWTWIDDAPWGFAPFHYGRWVQVRSRWCWWPGTYQARPVYAPALVAWIGSPSGGLTISSGPSVGWFPLAPREYYVPRYNYSAGYGRRINYITNNNITVINPPSHYRNHVPGATIVPNATFMNGNPVGNNRVQLAPRDIGSHRPSSHFDATPGPRRNPPTEMRDRVQGSQSGVPRPRFPAPPVSGGTPSTPPAFVAPSSGPVPPVEKRRPEPVRVGPLPVQPQQKPAGEAATSGAFPVEPSPARQSPQYRRPQPPASGVQPGYSAPIPSPASPAATPPQNIDREPRAMSPRPQRPQPNDGARIMPPPGGIPAPDTSRRPQNNDTHGTPSAPKPPQERVSKPRAEVKQDSRDKENDGPNRPKKD